MNAEKLNALAAAIRDDLSEIQAQQHLTELRDALNRSVQSPSEPSYQTQVSAALDGVRASLAESIVNRLSPADLQRLDDMGILGCLGNNLLDEVERLFATNAITPSVVLEQVNDYLDAYNEIIASLDSLVNAMHYFRIERHDLEPGDCEISIELPREFVASDLDRLSKEMRLMNRMVRPFQQLATGERPSIEVKTLSTSWYTFVLDVDPSTGAAFLKAVSWVLDQYERVLRLRQITEQLEQEQFSDVAMEVRDRARAALTGSIEPFVDSLLDDYSDVPQPKGTERELARELTLAVEDVAYRVDSGVRIEVRALPPAVAEDADEEGADDALSIDSIEAFNVINSLAPRLRHMSFEGRQIFELGEIGHTDDDDGSGTADREPTS